MSGAIPTTAQREAAEAVENAMAAITSAHEWRGALPPRGQLPFAIDDDDDHRRLQEAVPTLRQFAAAADDALAVADEDNSDSD